MLTSFAIFKTLKMFFSSIEFDAICDVFKNSNLSSHQLNSKSNGSVLLLNNNFRDCFLSFFCCGWQEWTWI